MSGFYLVNTNETYRPESKDFMLANNCICAQFNSKEQIDQIGKNDVVFLYQNRVGIIALGIADGRVRISDFEGEADEQHWMGIDRFRQPDSPIAPADISEVAREMTGVGVYYARTVIPLHCDVGEVLYERTTGRHFDEVDGRSH